MTIGKIPLIKESHADYLLFRFRELEIETDRFERAQPDSVIGMGVDSGPHLLMNYLYHHPERVRDRRVFEPFAGAGPLGMTALMLGAREVTFLDINQRAVSFTRRNIERNGFDAARSRLHTGDVATFVLDPPCDLLLANPPFIPIPQTVNAPIHSDGGIDGNRLARLLVSRLDDFLAPHGQALVYSFQFETENGLPLLARSLREHCETRPVEITRLLDRSISRSVLIDAYREKVPHKREAIDAWASALTSEHGHELGLNWHIFHIGAQASDAEISMRSYTGDKYGSGFFPWRTQADQELVLNTVLSLIEVDDRIFW